MSEIDFWAIPIPFKEQDRIFSNLIAIQSLPIPSKHLIHVKKITKITRTDRQRTDINVGGGMEERFKPSKMKAQIFLGQLSSFAFILGTVGEEECHLRL
jgi:hypothetical protein